MHVAIDHVPGTSVVRVSGELDVLTVPDLRVALHALTAEGCCDDVVVDLSEVEFLDATGLGVLVGVHRRAIRCGVGLELRNPPPRVRRLLAVTRLDRVLRVTAALDPVA